jgi:hypothetical protein
MNYPYCKYRENEMAVCPVWGVPAVQYNEMNLGLV